MPTHFTTEESHSIEKAIMMPLLKTFRRQLESTRINQIFTIIKHLLTEKRKSMMMQLKAIRKQFNLTRTILKPITTGKLFLLIYQSILL